MGGRGSFPGNRRQGVGGGDHFQAIVGNVWGGGAHFQAIVGNVWGRGMFQGNRRQDVGGRGMFHGMVWHTWLGLPVLVPASRALDVMIPCRAPMGVRLHGTPYIYIMVKKLSDRNRYSFPRWGIIFRIGAASSKSTGRDLDFVRRFQVVVRENKATGLVSGWACGMVGRPWPRSLEVWAPWLGLGLALRASASRALVAGSARAPCGQAVHGAPIYTLW